MKLTKAQLDGLSSIAKVEEVMGHFHKERASKTYNAVRANMLERLLTLGLIESRGSQ